jgi:predicted permease
VAWWHAAREWLATAVARERQDRELDDEITYHLELETAALIASGLPEPEARRRAEERFGNPRQVAQATRDERGGFFIGETMQDLRWALRSLMRSPGFTSVAGIVLALAIAATTSVFSVVNAVILRPLPYAEPHALVALGSVHQPPGGVPRDMPVVALTDVERWRRGAPATIEAMGAFALTQLAIRVGEEAFSPVTALVDPEFLGVLGVRLARGTHFQRGDPGMETTVIISHRLWRDAFDSDSVAVGRAIDVDGRAFTLRGVLPEGFQFPRSDASFFTKQPDMVMLSAALQAFPPGSKQWLGIARLREGVAIARATDDLRTVVARIGAEAPELRDWSVSLTSLAEATTKSSRTALMIVLAVGVVLLVIAAFNVMNLQFSRGAARLHAMAIRRAMGCSTGRLVRQLLLESALLTFTSGIAGILLAAIATNAIVALSPVYLPVTGTIGIDARVVVFVLGVCAVTALLAGTLPAVYAARGSEAVVKSAGARSTGGGTIARVQRALCVAQIALGIALLAVSGALVGELLRLRAVDPGFRTDNVLGFSFSLPTDKGIPERRTFYQSALDEVRAIPGVESAGLISFLPPEIRAGVFMQVSVEGDAPPAAGRSANLANHLITSPGYFETVGMSVISGRALEEGDNENSRSVIVVNEAFVRRFLGTGNIIGRRLLTGFGGGRNGQGTPREIVGIARDVQDRGLNRKAIPTLYIPFRQFALPYGSMAIRTAGDPTGIAAEVRRRIQRVDNSVPLENFQALDARLSESLAEPRFYTYLASLCAGMALLFVTLGLYGIVSFSVSRRTSEFGIRMAVGASRTAIVRLVLAQSAWMAVLGTAIGLALALASSRALATLPFQVRSTDPPLLGVAATIVVIVVMAASYVPARRASRVSPLTALRAE